jgi:hypothetical protein
LQDTLHTSDFGSGGIVIAIQALSIECKLEQHIVHNVFTTSSNSTCAIGDISRNSDTHAHVNNNNNNTTTRTLVPILTGLMVFWSCGKYTSEMMILP